MNDENQAKRGDKISLTYDLKSRGELLLKGTICPICGKKHSPFCCGFCGSAAEKEDYIPKGSTKCSSYPCIASSRYISVEQWNTRAESAELARLQKENAELLEDARNGGDWFNEFQKVNDYMLEHDLWIESDIGEKPSDALIAGIARLRDQNERYRELLKQIGGERCGNYFKFDGLEFSDCLGEMEYFKTQPPIYNQSVMDRILAGKDLCPHCLVKQALSAEGNQGKD